MIGQVTTQLHRRVEVHCSYGGPILSVHNTGGRDERVMHTSLTADEARRLALWLLKAADEGDES